MFACFGCSLDVLDAPEKLSMKLAYLDALREGRIDPQTARDPYGLLAPALGEVLGIVTAGRLEIESWMTPRPSLEDAGKIDVSLCREFLDTGGCAVVATRLREFVRQRVMPLSPLLIGVDHSLTGGVLEAICSTEPEVRTGLIVLDSHLDAIPASVRRAASGDARASRGDVPRGPAGETGSTATTQTEAESPDSYNCGTWLAAVLERGLVSPGDVVVLGPSDAPAEPEAPGADEGGEGFAAFRDAYGRLLESGVRVISRRRLREAGALAAAAEAVGGLETGRYYISIDADIGAGDKVAAVRFMDAIGLEPAEVVDLCGALGRAIDDSGGCLVGMDVTEIDVHLADIPGSSDRTLEMAAGAIGAVLRAAGETG